MLFVPGGFAEETRLSEGLRLTNVLNMSEAQLLSRITIDPAICHGKPCIRGLRYPVSMLLELLSGGMTAEQIIGDYPDIAPDDLRAAYALNTR